MHSFHGLIGHVPQVGVGGLVVCYTIFGAIAFQAIETTDETDDLIEKVGDDEKPYPNNLACQVSVRRSAAVSELWNITNHFNTLNRG